MSVPTNGSFVFPSICLPANKSNTVIGTNAMPQVHREYHNVAVGTLALRDVKSGHENVAVGSQSGLNLKDGVQNTLLGFQATVDSPGRSGCIVLGAKTQTSPTIAAPHLALGPNLSIVHEGVATNDYLEISINGKNYKLLLHE